MMTMQPIGTVFTEHKSLVNMPVQPVTGDRTTGKIVLDEKFSKGLESLDGFSHIYMIYLFHKSVGYDLTVTPFLDNKQHGLFATRAPRRPNPVGLSIVRLLSVHENVIEIENPDLLDGTPLLDIKPYIEIFDHPQDVISGWMTASKKELSMKKADDRFIKP
jgi:tRNA-Thr(GGU) m(6)t(6)A37 methyltransferase TsaA